MNKLNVTSALLWVLLLFGCGGGGESSSSGGQAPGSASSGSDSSGSDSNSGGGTGSDDSQQSTGFAALEVDADFDWQMDEGADLSFELVSLISQGRGQHRGASAYSQNEWLSISGRYVVNVFAIDADGNVLTNSIFTGMTNQYGQLAVNFTLMDGWLGVVVDVDIDGQAGGQSCSQSIYRDELDETVQLGCDIAIGSDL